MDVIFYFDPSCPFSWITSRWLLLVSEHRDVRVTWRPFCLALKNNELVSKPGESPHAASHRDSHRMLRVMLAAEKLHGTELITIYNASGMVRHILGEPLSDEAMKTVLHDLVLPESLLQYADDSSYDTALQHSIAEAVAVVGSDVGVPTIVFENAAGTKQGYFGPVLNELPSQEESLAIWDGLAQLATVKSFYELKRARPAGDPNVASTARC